MIVKTYRVYESRTGKRVEDAKVYIPETPEESKELRKRKDIDDGRNTGLKKGDPR